MGGRCGWAGAAGVSSLRWVWLLAALAGGSCRLGRAPPLPMDPCQGTSSRCKPERLPSLPPLPFCCCCRLALPAAACHRRPRGTQPPPPPCPGLGCQARAAAEAGSLLLLQPSAAQAAARPCLLASLLALTTASRHCLHDCPSYCLPLVCLSPNTQTNRTKLSFHFTRRNLNNFIQFKT